MIDSCVQISLLSWPFFNGCEFHFTQGESVAADSDEDMLNINGELGFTAGVMVRPPSDSIVSNEPSDHMREGDLGLGAVGLSTRA